MPKRAWLTPDSLPATFRCVRVLVPDSLELEAVFRGALLNLTYAYNWEKAGAATPEDTADLFWQGIEPSLEMRACMSLIGAIFYYPSESIKPTMLKCNGQALLKTDYPELFAVIGSTYGGDELYFNVPDLADKFIASSGGGYNLNDTGGANTVSLSEAQTGTHSHGLQMTTFLVAPGAIPVYGFTLIPTISTRPAGSGDAHENRPPYHALVPVIVAKDYA